MTPTEALLDAVQASIASTGPLGNGNKTVQLSKGNFDEITGENWLDADFGGYEDIELDDSFDSGREAVTDGREIYLPPPAGGFVFAADNTIDAPQTIYGYRVRDLDNNMTLGHKKFSDPIVISVEGEKVHIEETVRFFLSPVALA